MVSRGREGCEALADGGECGSAAGIGEEKGVTRDNGGA